MDMGLSHFGKVMRTTNLLTEIPYIHILCRAAYLSDNSSDDVVYGSYGHISIVTGNILVDSNRYLLAGWTSYKYDWL